MAKEQSPVGHESGRLVDERRIAAWIGKAVAIKGDITSSEDLTIDGRVEGTIELSNNSLIIRPGASVTADLVGKTITIAGSVSGNVRASHKVDLQATGHVKGDISAPRFAMAEGAVVMGRIETGGAKASTGGQPSS